jgi:hypothetical protein
MNDIERRALIGAAGIGALAALSKAGPLNPPAGAVAPTGKTTQELFDKVAAVESRTAINATNTPGNATALFRITQRGSYYLTGNIAGVAGKHGISIEASGVTLDLNGFDLVGVAGSLDGVSVTVSSLTNIAVTNGSVRNWGDDGVDCGTVIAFNCRVEGVRATGNLGHGIHGGSGGTVSSCTAYANSGDGISAATGCTVSNCSASYNIGIGINALHGCTVSNCSASYNTGSGISTESGCTVSSCTSYNTPGAGISAIAGGAVLNCTVRENDGYGIEVGWSCMVSGNTCAVNGSPALGPAGIRVSGNDNRIEGNSVTGGLNGILLSAGVNGNYVVRNHASGNITNYDNPASGNFIGTIIGSSAGMNAASNGLVNISY